MIMWYIRVLGRDAPRTSTVDSDSDVDTSLHGGGLFCSVQREAARRAIEHYQLIDRNSFIQRRESQTNQFGF